MCQWLTFPVILQDPLIRRSHRGYPRSPPAKGPEKGFPDEHTQLLPGPVSVDVRPAGSGAVAPLPAGWPARFELGMADAPGGAAAMKPTAPFASAINTWPAA